MSQSEQPQVSLRAKIDGYLLAVEKGEISHISGTEWVMNFLESTAKEVIGENSHTPLLESLPNGPHIMDTEKNELRAEQLARLAALLRGEEEAKGFDQQKGASNG